MDPEPGKGGVGLKAEKQSVLPNFDDQMPQKK